MNRILLGTLFAIACLTTTPPTAHAEYVDGMSLYRGYFVPGGTDPLGKQVQVPRWGEAVIVIRPNVYVRSTGKEEHDGFEDCQRGHTDKIAGRKGWAVLDVDDLADANDQIKDVNCACVKKLIVIAHAGPGFHNVGSIKDPERGKRGRFGVRWNEDGLRETFGFSLFDNIRWCRKCTIDLRGCQPLAGAGGKALGAALKKATGCSVVGFKKATFPGRDDGLPGPK